MLARRAIVLMMLASSVAPGIALSQTAAGPGSPAGVVRTLLDAMAANDAAGIRSAFAPEASQAYGDGAPKSGEAFARWLQSDIIDRHGRVEEPRLTENGAEVIVTGRYRNNAGYASAANFLFQVTNGRIVSWRMRY